MGLLFINIMLAFLWSALTGGFTLENLTVGFGLGYFILYLLRGVISGGAYFSKAFQILRFLAFFLMELILANLRVARDVLRPGPLRTLPRVIAVPTDLPGDAAVTLFSVVLSLTPGTLLLDVADDRKTVFIHAIDAPDKETILLEIKQGFERMVAELFAGRAGPPEATQQGEQ